MAEAKRKTKYYNILSMDGGGIRGLIPAKVVEYMEKYAYEHCVVEKGYKIPTYEGKEDVIAMKDLFDMISGTSTGSIIAAAITYKDEKVADKPKYYAKEVLKVYSTQGN